MRENAAYLLGIRHKFLPDAKEDRILRINSHLIFSRVPDNSRTNASRICRSRHSWGGKAYPTRPKWIDKKYKPEKFSANSASI
jgi:hypothetical protein